MSTLEKSDAGKDPPGLFGKQVLILAIINVTVFSIVWTIEDMIFGHVPDTVCTGFYDFWGGEIVILSAIKIGKISYNYLTESVVSGKKHGLKKKTVPDETDAETTDTNNEDAP